MSPPACSGPRTFYAAAKDGAQSDQRHREAAARFREQKDAQAPLPPDVPINQVCCCSDSHFLLALVIIRHPVTVMFLVPRL